MQTAGQLLRVTLTIFAVPLAISGRWDWVPGWIPPGLLVVLVSINYLVLRRINPEVIQARSRNNIPQLLFDRIFSALALFFTVVLLVVAGLGARFRWNSLPAPWIAAGWLLMCVGSVPILWAAAVNKYLETTVRIQTERGHQAVRTGPYRFIRHPMYAGLILLNIGWGLGYGYVWACIPALILAGFSAKIVTNTNLAKLR